MLASALSAYREVRPPKYVIPSLLPWFLDSWARGAWDERPQTSSWTPWKSGGREFGTPVGYSCNKKCLFCAQLSRDNYFKGICLASDCWSRLRKSTAISSNGLLGSTPAWQHDKIHTYTHAHMHILEEPLPSTSFVSDELLSGVGPGRMEVGVGLDSLLPWVAEGAEGGWILGVALVRNTRSSFFPLGKSTKTI